MAKKQNGFVFEDKLIQVPVNCVRGKVFRRKALKQYEVTNRSDVVVQNYMICGYKLNDKIKLSSVVIYKLETVFKTMISNK